MVGFGPLSTHTLLPGRLPVKINPGCWPLRTATCFGICVVTSCPVLRGGMACQMRQDCPVANEHKSLDYEVIGSKSNRSCIECVTTVQECGVHHGEISLSYLRTTRNSKGTPVSEEANVSCTVSTLGIILDACEPSRYRWLSCRCEVSRLIRGQVVPAK